MKLRTFLLLIVGCSIAGIAYAATTAPDPNTAHAFAVIDFWFAVIGHFFGKLNEFSGTFLLTISGLLAVGLELLRRVRNAQKQATLERQAIAAEARDHLTDVKAAVADVPAKVSEVAAAVAADLAKTGSNV